MKLSKAFFLIFSEQQKGVTLYVKMIKIIRLIYIKILNSNGIIS